MASFGVEYRPRPEIPCVILEGMMTSGTASLAARRGGVILAVWLGWAILAATAQAATLTRIRHSSTAERTRIVLDLSAKTSFAHRSLSDPPRVVIDLADGIAGPQAQPRTLSDGFVKAVRLNDIRSGKLQVVLELEKSADYSVFTLSDPFRVVVDVKHVGSPVSEGEKPTPAAAKAGAETLPADKGTGAKSSTTAPVPEPRPPLEIAPPPRDAWVIAIDAGHGGQDQGAHYFKTSEKDITLALARELKSELENRGKVKPLLVRKGDYFIPLRRRWTLAEKQGANLFVSIHCNATEDGKAQGTEVFFLSLKGATDARSQDLAERENEVDQQMGVSVAEDDLDAIVFDMMQTDVLSKSQMLAEGCLTHLYGLGTVYGRGVKQAGFAVLKSPRIPSILVEAAFLSHKDENELLRDPGWQREFARRLADGIEAYVASVDTAEKLEKH
jgi:N-acetylmuramoyl-L-alanine amidase